MSHYAGIVAMALIATGITLCGVLFGWAMDHSLVPSQGGGWRCYASGIASAWGLVVLLAMPVGLPLLVSRFAKTVACHWAEL